MWPPELTANADLACLVRALDLKNRLGDIQTNCANLLHGRLLSVAFRTTTLWHFDAGTGAVHPIIHDLPHQQHRPAKPGKTKARQERPVKGGIARIRSRVAKVMT